MIPVPTYLVRLQQHGDSDELWYVFTITRQGFRHDFGHDLEESVAKALHADLSKLSRGTIAWLAGDADDATAPMLTTADGGQRARAPSEPIRNRPTRAQLAMIQRLIGELEYVRETGDLRDSLTNEPVLIAEARRMFDLPIAAILPDGTRRPWDERLAGISATPVYDKDEEPRA